MNELLDCSLKLSKAMTESIRLNILDERLPKRGLSFTQKFFVFLGVLFGIFLLIFGLFIFSTVRMHSDQQVSGEITVSSEWMVITPQESMKPHKQYQHLVLDVAEPLKKDNLDLENIRFADGTPVYPEAQIVDEHGNVYVLKMERAPTPSRHGNSIFDYGSRLPEDRVYTQVRLRSDKPLHLSGVLWHCYDGK